jgi:hypothetical protein
MLASAGRMLSVEEGKDKREGKDVAEDSVCGMRPGCNVAPGINRLLLLFSTLLNASADCSLVIFYIVC